MKFKIAQPFSGETGSFPVLVEEQALSPRPSSRKTVPNVNDNGGAGALPGRDDRQHCRIAFRGLIVKDDRVEFGNALLRHRQESRLRADKDVCIPSGQERIRPAPPRIGV